MQDTKFVFALALLVVAIAAFPTLYAVIQEPDGMVYSGRHAQNSGDYGIYFSQMEQARQGHILFKNLHTSEPQERSIFNPVWLTLGWISRVTNLSVPITFHFFRLILIPLFVLVLARLVSMFFDDRLKQRIALTLIVFAGGIGGYAQTTDASAFHAMLFSPHLILSFTLLISFVIFMLRAQGQFSVPRSLIAGLGMGVLFLFHPYHISTVFALAGAYIVIQLLRRQRIRGLLLSLVIATLVSYSSILYHWWFFRTSPIGATWLAQSDTLMNPKTPWSLLWAFGPLVLLAGFGLSRMLRVRHEHRWFLAVWLVVPLVFMWIPWFFRMRVSGGWTIALSLAAAEAMAWIISQSIFRKTVVVPALSVIVAILLLMPVHIRTFAMNLATYQQGIPLAYLPNNFVNVGKYAKTNVPEDTLILTSWYTGNIFPGLTARAVYGGHGIQTLHPEEKGSSISAFFGTMNEEERIAFLRRERIGYVLISPFEQTIGAASSADWLLAGEALQEAYRSGDYALYRVL